MAQGHSPDAVEAQEQEAALTASLEASHAQLRAQSDAFYQRSKLRTARGDHDGAVEDAKRALALFSNDVQVSGA